MEKIVTDFLCGRAAFLIRHADGTSSYVPYHAVGIVDVRFTSDDTRPSIVQVIATMATREEWEAKLFYALVMPERVQSVLLDIERKLRDFLIGVD